MKASLTASRLNRSVFKSPFFELLPVACLLGLASMLAIVGGVGTSALFFGLLFFFPVLIVATRHLDNPKRPRGPGDHL